MAEVTRATLLVLFSSSVLVAAVSQAPTYDRGAAGTWLRLQRLRTTASVMHTTAHPDDEHGGMLAMMSHGVGARVTLLTLTRGESGDNAIGPELFDALGLIRTEELLVADRFYGLDYQYFTTAIDYGFSKRLDEALDKWGREHVLRDVVRVIRTDRPFVLISRFQGNPRDGHGQHQAAGLLTQEAWKVAGDPNAFPEQITQGLRPWQPLKLYIGGVRENEDWTIGIDTGEYDPILGDSYDGFARFGLSFQRSQNGGRVTPRAGSSVAYYRRLQSRITPGAGAGASRPTKERSFFDGIDTRMGGIFSVIDRPAPAGAQARLDAIDREVDAAIGAFSMGDPAACVPALARGLAATREAIDFLRNEPEVLFVLDLKEQQFMDAIDTALGLEFTAVRDGELAGPVVPGQSFDVRLALANRSRVPVSLTALTVVARGGENVQPMDEAPATLGYSQRVERRVRVALPDDAPVSKPYFRRDGIQQHRYDIVDTTAIYSPTGTPRFLALASYAVDGVPVRLYRIVRTRESQLPYGDALRELKVVPVLAVNVRPRLAVVPRVTAAQSVPVDVELLNNKDGPIAGALALRLPTGWTSDPLQAPFAFARTAEKRQFRFVVSIPTLADRDYRIEVVATADGREYREGYDVIEKRDLETRFLFRSADVRVRGVDVKIAPGLVVGYVMGVGDEVPSGISQLGATVELLDEEDLASGDLRRFDAIMTGTRAYAVRSDLRTYNHRLLDYVKTGGNLIVLYNTLELDPKTFAPYRGELTARAEEVSEEDSPVDILAPTHPAFRRPNVITMADFDGWIEQRGTKFWSSWDPAYTALLATWDKGQSPQRGGWLHAKYGNGHYTYFAYAFHRQLPYGVPGAYRLLANLLSLARP